MIKNKFSAFYPPFLFLAAFLLYLKTLSPGLYFGDSGELLAMIYTLGQPHPTGFPLYILLGKIFSLAGFGSFAFKINIMSAFFAALIPVVLFYCLRILLKNEDSRIFQKTILAALPLIFIFSHTLWSQAVIARIYTLNALFCAAALYLFLYIDRIKADKKSFYLLAFLTGLGAGLHLSFAVFAGILWIYLFPGKKQIIFRKFWMLLFFFSAGLSIYAYLYIRGLAQESLLQWHPIYRISDFLEYITQQNYSHKMFSRGPEGFIAFFSFTLKALLREFSAAGFIIMAAGMAAGIIKKYRYSFLFLVIFASNILLLAFYGEYTDLKLSFRYYIPSYIAGIFFIAVFFRYIKSVLTDGKMSALITAAVSAVIIFAAAHQNYIQNDRSENFIAHNYPKDLVGALPENSYLFTNGDNQIFTIAYYQFVEGKRRDVTIFDSALTIYRDMRELMLMSGSSKMVTNILHSFTKDMSPVFLTTKIGTPVIYETLYGITYRANEDPAPHNPEIIRTFSLNGIVRNTGFHSTFEEREIAGTYLYRMAEHYRLSGRTELFAYLLDESVKTGFDSVPVLGNAAIIYADTGDFKKAEELIARALKVQPENIELLFNMGSFKARQGRFMEAAEYYDLILDINPSHSQARHYKSTALQQNTQMQMKKAAAETRNADYNKGLELLKEKKISEAIPYFEADIKNNPDTKRSVFYLGLAYSLAEDYDRAIKYFEKVLESDPVNIMTLNNLGLIYKKLGNKEKSAQYFNRSLELNRNQPAVEKHLLEL
ncbi:MAG: protein O-mannosyl-transferase family, partial [Candidatus Goldiibacteriota bacterium]